MNQPLSGDELQQMLAEIVGAEHAVTRAEQVAAQLHNSLGVQRQVLGVVYPEDAGQVRRLVHLAQQHRIPLFPVSRGMNRGYGDVLPIGDGQLLVNLSRMNRIRSFDMRLGLVEVEPGVSQGQLCRFLEERGGEYMADVTDATAEASIIGNTLEGGFGHTPLGDRRREIVDVEAVLGNGELFSTGKFPGIGPDLAGLFVQSNFGIVTAITCRVMLRPPKVQSIFIRLDDERKLGKLIETLSALKQRGIIDNIPRVANAVRTVMATHLFSEVWNRDEALTMEDAQGILSTRWSRAGAWNGMAALYGSRREVAYKRRILREALRSLATVRFFADPELRLGRVLLQAPLIRRCSWAEKLRKSHRALTYIHGLAKGIPGELTWEHSNWRVGSEADVGIIRHSPVLDPTQHDIAELLRIGGDVFRKFGFEMPLTMSLLDASHVVCIFSICFNKNDKGERERAYGTYYHLSARCLESGFSPYRLGLLGMRQLHYLPGKAAVLRSLKSALDPNDIIAPGRYIPASGK